MNPVSPPRLLQPGLLPFIPGLERHRARGGGACFIALDEGDTVTFTDREGRQACEIVALDPQGGLDLGALGLGSKQPATAIHGEDGKAVAATLRRHGVEGEGLKLAVLFGDGSLPGEAVTLTAQRSTVCIITAPGGPMAVDAQNPPTEITVTVQRVHIDPQIEHPLPPPLADARLDFRISKATAQAYEVKAGEFI